MKVIITDPISPSGVSLLTKAGFDVLQLHNSSKMNKKASVDADGWIVRSGTKINEKMIQAAKN
ncbi:MAG: hypothetical protein CM15mP13_1730 [Pseudomonadota bacterium]|nr:MAG: hypothetical protein CM15mP13_1730 [Pseudomonadota bacterium]